MTIHHNELEYKDGGEDFRFWSFGKFKRDAINQLVEGFVVSGSRGVGTALHTVLVDFMQWKSNHDERVKELEASKRKSKADNGRKGHGAAQ